MEEELKAMVDRMNAANRPLSEIKEAIAEYKAKEKKLSKSTSTPEPTLDADGINIGSYINNTFWESTGINRDSYFDEEGNLVDPNAGSFAPMPDLGYEQILKELETKNILTRDSSRTEDTATEGEFEVTDEDKENISKNAESTYETYVQQEIDYLNITDEDRKA